jgi:hypothetical protein
MVSRLTAVLAAVRARAIRFLRSEGSLANPERSYRSAAWLAEVPSNGGADATLSGYGQVGQVMNPTRISDLIGTLKWLGRGKGSEQEGDGIWRLKF